MDGLTYEIALKKFVLACEWKDVELNREALIDLEKFEQDESLAGEDPVVLKRVAAEKKAAKEAGKLQELLEQWHQEVLPYIWCKFKYLYKYFGDPEVQPLWQRYPATFRMSLNVDIACLEQTGPLLEEDIAQIVQAMKDSIGHEKGVSVLFDAFGEVTRMHLARLSKKSVEG